MTLRHAIMLMVMLPIAPLPAVTPAAALDASRKAGGEAGTVWSAESLPPFWRNPRQDVAGTRMAFAGQRNEQRTTDRIAYLRQAIRAGR